jgi:tRNA (guanine-N7-)-methyltransferase
MPPIRRVRQHVNPLSIQYANPVESPVWADIFDDAQRPLHVDVGCGKGDFVREMAALSPDWNFLGLEIRAPLVERSLLRRDRKAFQENHTLTNQPSAPRANNLHFIFCNANNSLTPLLANWPGGCPLQRVSIQFPDPWFKKRHQKRRVVQPELVAAIAAQMPTGGMVWLQSDVEELCLAMCDRFDENTAFVREGSTWLTSSPFAAQTDREKVTLAKGLPVYRAMYFRR